MKLPRVPASLALAAGLLTSGAALASRSDAPDAPGLDDRLDDRLAAGMADWLDRGITPADFGTGDAVFDHEWVFGTWQMAALGYGQHALAHPEAKAGDLANMERCIDGMLSEQGRAFDRAKWDADPLESLSLRRGHM